MAVTPINDAVLGLLWNAWTELGVPGTERKHRRVVVDPDPLIVFTPALARDDPRLLEQAATWCERHGDTVAKTRLLGLVRSVPGNVGSAFSTFVENLGGAAAQWRGTKGIGRQVHASPSSPPPLERPALARFRMRALSGTGARADVLCELLALQPGAWTSATDLERLGYSRRNVARVLVDLATAGIASERSGKGPASFRLRESRALATLIAAENLSWPDWCAILTLSWHLIELELSPQAPAALAQVKAHDARENLRRLSLAVGAREPPPTTGDPSALPNLLRWGLTVLRSWPFESLEPALAGVPN